MNQNLDPGLRYVRVTGCRSQDLIEFDFAIGSPELFVELMMPEAAFAEFCRLNNVVMLPSGDSGHHSALDWRLRDVTAALTEKDNGN
jgi:phenol hydroxylase P0 protein